MAVRSALGIQYCSHEWSIKPTVKARTQSLFSQIFAGDAGYDLYTLAVSDVYQDLFGEGSYIGKGIYDVAAFARSLKGQVRDNTLLSHDLLEGIFGRAALVTDVILYEEYPARYLVHACRLRRWIEADWQVAALVVPVCSNQKRNRPQPIIHHRPLENFR